ncbi:GntR family transcriptional regulator [Chromobacterium violaceum]|uniref:Putative 8-amino-7-oxononanoate synthase n=1 Tax=Chromobacterium violaceum TaxID=536 RepID=A0A202B6E5_CHRVL|nr:PLP-dependent aminotransferase family protein [Chromobacterium violaceum]OQS12275.1 GntR family transcriptional regulator [Chromobacterium violaceum]OQS28289.1 GntR family transcriptional regulator [Chromobacterium violaceum]OVE46985.1 PLP-dependent aminotransferase family protein [Chromobacterium violaceum]
MSGETLYQQLVNEWMELIRNGTVRPGERLPSVRKACAMHKVSPSTILQTYRMLEDRGLIEARPQSGFYVKSAASLPLPRMRRQSAAHHTGEVVDQIEAVMGVQSQADFIDLSLASPRGSDFYPTTRFKHIMGRLLRQHPELTTDYPFPPGSERLRRQIAQRAVNWGCVLAADELVISNGCTEALQLALRAVCKPGDTVGVESPTYFALLPMLKDLGLAVIEIPTHPTSGLALDALELLLSEKRLNAVVAMPTVHNPLGSTMPPEAKRRLAQLVNDYQVPLIEDVPHAELFYGASTPDAVKAYDRDGWVLLCSSYSKTLAPGFRIGWIAPGRFLSEVRRLKFSSSLGQPALLEETLAEYLESGGYDHHLRLLRRHFISQMEKLRGAVAQHFPDGTRATLPSGGCLLWVELPSHADTMQLFRAALAERITVVPGAMYSAKGRYRNCLRLSCCYPWNEAYQRALIRVGELAGELAEGH